MRKVTAATPPSPLRAFWLKWRFHINILLVLVPLGFMPKYFADAALFRGDTGIGERKCPTLCHLGQQRQAAQHRAIGISKRQPCGFGLWLDLGFVRRGSRMSSSTHVLMNYSGQEHWLSFGAQGKNGTDPTVAHGDGQRCVVNLDGTGCDLLCCYAAASGDCF